MRDRQFAPSCRNLEERVLCAHPIHALPSAHPTRALARAVPRALNISLPQALAWFPTNVPVPTHLNVGANGIGDCVTAALDNTIIVQSTAVGYPDYPSDAATLAQYERVGGYQPGNPATDQGEWPLSAELDWTTHPLEGVRAISFAGVNFRSIAAIERGVFLYGSVQLSVALPLSAVDQFTIGQTWDVSTGPRAAPYSAGGHELDIDGYDPTGPLALTWGRTVQLTWQWVDTYANQAFATLTNVWTYPTGRAPNGFSQSQLLTNLKTLI
jgi:hypothetical protein